MTGPFMRIERCRYPNEQKLQYFIRGTFQNLSSTGGVVLVQPTIYKQTEKVWSISLSQISIKAANSLIEAAHEETQTS